MKEIDEDPIIAEIRHHRKAHAEKYGHDLKRICEALRAVEQQSAHKVVRLKPRPLPAAPKANWPPNQWKT